MNQDGPYRQFVAKIAIAIGITALAVLLWMLRDILLLAFAGVLVAVVLHAIGNRLQRHLGVGQGIALLIATLLLFGITAGFFYLMGAELVTQLRQLGAQLPDAWEKVRKWVEDIGYGDELKQGLNTAMPDGGTVFGVLRSLIGGVGGAASAFVVAILVGIFIAAHPRLYLDGVIKLFPASAGPRISAAMERTGQALRHWIAGQTVSMAFTAVAIGIGLMVIGVPTPLALAAIAGVMGFVPMIGPLIGAAAGLLVAATVDFETLWQTALLYLVVQQLAGSVIEPLIMQHTVHLPPALTILGLLAIGIVLGPAGVLLGGPLLVAIYVLVRELYVKGTLHHHLEGE